MAEKALKPVKPFLNYEEQIHNLVERKGMVITDHKFAVSKLEDISYFALVDGYKNMFYNPMTRKYREGTTFEDIVALYEFDEQLRAETEKLDGIRKKHDKFDKIISAPKWISELKKYHDSKMLTKDMVEAFIEKIIIYPDKRIEIMWTYSDKQSELMSLISGGEEIA